MQTEEGGLAYPFEQGEVERNFRQEKSGGWKIQEKNQRGIFFEESFSLGKNNKEVEKQGRENEKSQFVEPVEEAVESVHLTGRRKDIKRIESQRNEVKIDIGHRERLAGVEKDNQADDQSDETDEGQVIINGRSSLLSQIKGGEHQLTLADDLIIDFDIPPSCLP